MTTIENVKLKLFAILNEEYFMSWLSIHLDRIENLLK